MLGFSPLANDPLASLPVVAGGGGTPTITDLLTSSFAFTTSAQQNAFLATGSTATLVFTQQSVTPLVTLNTIAAAIGLTPSSITHSTFGQLSAAALTFTAQSITFTAAMLIELTLAAFSKLTSPLSGLLSATTTTANLNQTAQNVTPSVLSTASTAAINFTSAAITSVTNGATLLTLATFNLLARVIDITYTPSTPPIAKWRTIRGIIRGVINSDD